MEREALEQLKQKEILSPENVSAIRRYIREKYIDYKSEEHSAVFADAIHRIIDTNMPKLSIAHRQEAKNHLLQYLLSKPRFAIDASEVFGSSLAVSIGNEIEIMEIANWLEEQHDLTIAREDLKTFAGKLDAYDLKSITAGILDIFDEVASVEQAAATVAEAPIIIEAYCIESTSTDARAINIDRVLLFRELVCALKGSYKTVFKVCVPAVMALCIGAMLLSNQPFALPNEPEGYFMNSHEALNDNYLTLESKMHSEIKYLEDTKTTALIKNELPEDLKYVEVDKVALKTWLNEQDSMLADEPYFSEIISAAKRYDVNPLLLIAITGQEQAFVPRSSFHANLIVNNPFNVYGSWEKYNTNIGDASNLAARIIVNSSKKRPAYMNPIRWINRSYAEDQNWWKGVSQVFVKMNDEILKP